MVRAYERDLACDVENDIQASGEYGLKLVKLGYVSEYVFGSSRHVNRSTRGLVINDRNLMTFLQKALSHMRTDEASSSGNQDPHERLFSFRVVVSESRIEFSTAHSQSCRTPLVLSVRGRHPSRSATFRMSLT